MLTLLQGLAVTIVLALLIVFGSRRLTHFDAALVACTAAILFATFGLTYRYSMWLQRPTTAVYWKRGWQTYFAPKHFGATSWLGCAMSLAMSSATALSSTAAGCAASPTCS